jgi:signal transduction histidine kinase
LEQVFDTGIPYHGLEIPATAYFQGNEQTTKLFNLSYTPCRDDNGVINGVITTANDVTEQVVLRKKDHNYELNQQAFNLFMQAPVGICILKGTDHIIELANAPMLNIWGKDKSIIGKPLMAALPEIDGQGFEDLLDSVKQNGQPIHANEHLASLIRNGKKEQVYLNFVYQPYREDDKTVNGVIAIATEVTEQVIAHKKVEEAEETARLAIASADLGAYEINLVTDEMTSTSRFNIIWGLNQSVSLTAYTAAVHTDDKPTMLLAHKDAVKTGKLFYEARIVWQDGSVHWVRVNGTVLFDVSGTPMRLAGVTQDITEQKSFSEEMKRLVTERTMELQKANEALEKSNVDLQQFAHVTSHDLQEPLRKIQVFAGRLMGKGELFGEALLYLEKISSSSERMRGLIHDLLEYSSLSKTNSQFRLVDLDEVLQCVKSDFELLIDQKKVIIHADKLETIEAVPLQINQLFYYLLGNALKFSKKNTIPVINIKAGRVSDEKKKELQLRDNIDYYEIVFSDNGIGFDQEYAHNIFTVFQRLNNRSEYGGYGIGLAVCSKVAANHHGLIYADGVANEGATFTIILPYRQTELANNKSINKYENN